MRDGPWDCIIVGGGLAGCCLAWELRFRGLGCLLIDRPGPGSASRVAAGLVAPFSGRRLAEIERFDADWRAAQAFYQRVEGAIGAGLLSVGPAVYAFTSRDQAEAFGARRRGPPPDPPLPAQYYSPHGAIQTHVAGRLNVAAFVDATHATWDAEGALRTAAVDPRSIRGLGDRVEVELDGRVLSAGRVVGCVGVAGVDWPMTAGLAWAPARGELLTVRLPGVEETRVVRSGVWLAPLGEGLFRVGATYDRDRLGLGPTSEGRAWLLRRLATLVDAPVEVVAHDSAVRPLLADRMPSAGWMNAAARVGWLNGLGSHGVLRAPRLAALLADHVAAG